MSRKLGVLMFAALFCVSACATQSAAPLASATTPSSPPIIEPPTEPPCPAREAVIYFSTGGAELTPSQRAELNALADASRACQVAAVVIVGHTDSTGPAPANLRLSQLRAEAVRSVLAEQGLPHLATDARGETDLARPTPDGVSEPLNRRTTVSIRYR